METSEASGVVLPFPGVVHTDVLLVLFAQFLDGLLDVSVRGDERETVESQIYCCLL